MCGMGSLITSSTIRPRSRVRSGHLPHLDETTAWRRWRRAPSIGADPSRERTLSVPNRHPHVPAEMRLRLPREHLRRRVSAPFEGVLGSRDTVIPPFGRGQEHTRSPDPGRFRPYLTPSEIGTSRSGREGLSSRRAVCIATRIGRGLPCLAAHFAPEDRQGRTQHQQPSGLSREDSG